MQCPSCKKYKMNSILLTPGLGGLVCGGCSGIWIARGDYDAWRSKRPLEITEHTAPAQLGDAESHKGKICPQCSHLLLPYRVGHGLPFSIDYCGACGGVWLESNEWDAIKAKNLHDDLHEIVSAHWQTAVRQAEVQDAIEHTYSRLLGSAYAKAKDMRVWLREQPQRGLILAYLLEMKPDKTGNTPDKS